MSSITSPKMFLAATVALVATPAALALVSTHNAHSSRQPFGRPSFLKLEANQQPFSELDNLRSKRLSIRSRLSEPEAEVAVESVAVEAVANDSLTTGLEYLYEAGEERHSDDLFHVILMPSTFHDDRMTIEHAAESCIEILGIPSDKAQDLSLFAKHQGFSCLGTWPRDECLSFGEELSSRDLDCRVIPFNEDSAPEFSFEDHDIDTQKAIVEDAFLLSFSD